MSNDPLPLKVQEFLEQFERVFQQEWPLTKANFSASMIRQFISDTGNFLDPQSEGAAIPWRGRDDLLKAYKELKESLKNAPAAAAPAPAETPAEPAAEPKAKPEAPAQPVAKEKETPAKEEKPAAEPAKKAEPAETEKKTEDEKKKTAAVAKAAPLRSSFTAPPSNAEQIKADRLRNEPAAVAEEKRKKDLAAQARLKRERTGEISFPSPHTAEVVFKKEPVAPKADEALAKCQHLIDGVEHERIRDFIVAEGGNSGSDKPSLIIYLPDAVWLDFAFDFAEGKRMLNKYPQRDGELIEFMKSTGKKL